MNRFIALPSWAPGEPPKHATAHTLPTAFAAHHDRSKMTPIFPDSSKKRFLRLAAIPARALNLAGMR
ncbi:hypothetical protein [Rhodanobacter sp. B05]|jgi:hypothetical protein|uniref:hypothetical protein n=1 Tax=Rhodanobacter sp. B05 TaxID=1945859 RepID=UPI0011159A5A|nr:hypothetical protein [Rhodanobacter sp. B05]